MTVDFHTHCFPDALAARAMALLKGNAAMKAPLDGTVAGLVAAMKRGGVDRSVMLQIAIELALEDDLLYEAMALKYFEHFLWIASAMDNRSVNMSARQVLKSPSCRWRLSARRSRTTESP